MGTYSALYKVLHYNHPSRRPSTVTLTGTPSAAAMASTRSLQAPLLLLLVPEFPPTDRQPFRTLQLCNVSASHADCFSSVSVLMLETPALILMTGNL